MSELGLGKWKIGSIKAAKRKTAIAISSTSLYLENANSKTDSVKVRLEAAFKIIIMKGRSKGYAKAATDFKIFRDTTPWYLPCFPSEESVDKARGHRVIASYFTQ